MQIPQILQIKRDFHSCIALQAGMDGGSPQWSLRRNFVFLRFAGPWKAADEGGNCLPLSQIYIFTF